MLSKDKFQPVFLDNFIINYEVAQKCKKIVNNEFIPNLLFHGPKGSGKYTLCKSIINSIYNDNIQNVDSVIRINNKEYPLVTSEYHFEICLDKYLMNKNSLCEIIDYLTDTKEINQICLIKIIVIRNINYCNLEIFSFIKNKIELGGSNYRFFVITNNTSYVPTKYRGLFFYIKVKYENKPNIEKYFKENKIKYDKKIIENERNLNILFTKNELFQISKSKNFSELKEKQIIKLIKDSINNPDNILKIREVIYEINIKNIKFTEILKNILNYFLKSEIDNEKKFKLCTIFAKYDHRSQTSYKKQVHYEALISKIIVLINS